MAKKEKVGVIGSGLGGLAAACTLAARGYSVVLFEKNPWLGGKAAEHADQGFRFDMGPTILTLPSVLKRIYAEAGRRLEDHMDLRELDPQWRSFFSDGSRLDLVKDTDAMSGILDQFTKTGATSIGYRRFMELSKKLDSISQRYFFWKSIGGIKDMIDPKNSFNAGVIKDVLTMRMGRTVSETLRSHIPDARVAQMVDHFTQYVGSAPDASPAVLCGIAHMQTNEGVWYPMGGTRSVPVALTRLATELGVEFRTGTGIKRILTNNGRATGVETDAGEVVHLSAVVSNCDSVRTHRELLEGDPVAKKFEKRRSYEPACSGVVLYLGLKKRYPQLLHHNFVFSRDPHEEFETIYRKGEPAPDPTAYVCAPSITEPGVAPAGCESLYVLVHTPFLRPHHDWKKMLPEYRQVILKKLADTADMKDLENQIVVERALTPQDIHDRYRVLNGAIYGLASHGRFFGAFKPGNRSNDLQGLYLAGGAAHPGPGMPMVMMSGWIAADTLDQDGRVPKTGEHRGGRSAEAPPLAVMA